MNNTTAATENEQTSSHHKDMNKTVGPDNTAGPAAFNALRFSVATVVAALAVLVCFFANQVYLFGSTFNQASRNHAFTIAAVNYDGDNSTVWNAFSQAYPSLAGDTFATFRWFSTPSHSEFPTPDHLVDAVRNRKYWAALYVPANASSRLAAAVSGQVDAYDASGAATYVWNEIRYPAVSASVVKAGILRLQTAAQKIYQAGALSTLMSSAASSHAEVAAAAYVSPFDAAEVNVAPAPQAEKSFYNTVVLAMGIVQQNIFLIALMGISRAMGLFTQPLKMSGAWALAIGLVFTLAGSLLTAGFIWAFREGWEVSDGQFFLTWMALWLVHHIYYQLIDGTLSLVPIQFYSLLIVTWVFLNITSTVFPLEYSPGFYIWGQALPGYQVLQLLDDIWTESSGKLYESLPVLFAWWVVSGAYAAIGTVKKVKANKGKIK